jgi:hypothetical protein
MANGEQLGSGGRDDWRSRLTFAVGAAIGGGLVMLVLNLADMKLFPLGLTLFCAGILAGGLLGRRAGSLLFRGPPADDEHLTG